MNLGICSVLLLCLPCVAFCFSFRQFKLRWGLCGNLASPLPFILYFFCITNILVLLINISSFSLVIVKMVALANEEALPHDEEIMDDVDSDVEESDSGEEAQAKPSDKAIYNKEAILEKLEDIAWPKNVDWMHKLTIEHDQGEKVDVNDDLARELAFYTQVLDGTRQAFEKLQSM